MASERVCLRLLQWDILKNADALFAYFPLTGEVDILPLIQDLSKKKAIYLPRISQENMDFHRVKSTDFPMLILNKWKIPEPPSFFPMGNPEDFSSPLMIVPGVAFTSKGERLGRGGGFYDRYLSIYGHRLTTAGVAYNCQLVDDLPMEPHDIIVNHIIY